MKNWKRYLIVCLTLFAVNSVMANKVVFLGDSNTALTYLNPRNNKSIDRDFRFTSLIGDPRSKYYIEGLSSINSAVGGAKTEDFLENGKYFSRQYNRGWDKSGDIYVICFGLNDAPVKVDEFLKNKNRYLSVFEKRTWSLIKLVKSYNPRAKIALMTNVPLNYNGGDFQYPRHLIIDEYDGIYRKMSKFKGINLVEVNKFLKGKIAQGDSDLRIRRYKVPVLSSSMDNSAEARRMGHRLWRTNIHYNTKGSSFVAEFLSTSLLRLR